MGLLLSIITIPTSIPILQTVTFLVLSSLGAPSRPWSYHSSGSLLPYSLVHVITYNSSYQYGPRVTHSPLYP